MWMVVLVFVFIQPAIAVTITVPDDYATIQEAIDAANAYDTVFVRAGVYHEHIVIAKSLTLLGEGTSTVIDGGGGGDVITIYSGEIKLEGLKAFNGTNGIYAPPGTYLPEMVFKNLVSDGNRDYGVKFGSLWSLSQFLIEDCTISNNGLDGLKVDSLFGGIIRNNEVFNNRRGIHIGFGKQFRLTGNRCHHNSVTGISFRGLDYLVDKNEFSENYYGVDFSLATGDGVFKENLVHGNRIGVLVQKGVRNVQVYHNDFIGNTTQVKYLSASVIMSWDNGYPSGGNYWSDYTGQDLDGDGIGDTPYPIWYHKDNYPLMRPLWYFLEADVDITPDSINLGSSGNTVSAYIQLPSGYDLADIDISSLVLNGVLQAKSKPVETGDYNKDGIPDLKVKFDRPGVILLIEDGAGDVELTLSGTVDGYKFKGSDLIKVIH
jgi:parallel beta-helix repeat protein